MEKEAKETLFRELYQLDEDSSQEDQSNASVILRASRLAPLGLDVSVRTERDNSVHSSRCEPSLLRTVSEPLPQPSVPKSRQADVAEKRSFTSTASSKLSEQIILDTPIMTKKTPRVTAWKDARKAIGKRKRDQPIELKPESQQIFKGLGFCRPE